MKILFTLLLILISFSFSQEPINYETTLIEKGHLFYTKDTNKPYSGPVFSLYDDGKKKEVWKADMDGIVDVTNKHLKKAISDALAGDVF